MTVEWGYCVTKLGVKAPSAEEIQVIEKEVESGNYQILEHRGKELGLFTPTPFTVCDHFCFAEEFNLYG